MQSASYKSDHFIIGKKSANLCIAHPSAMRLLNNKKPNFRAHSKKSSFNKNATAVFSFARLFFNENKVDY